MFSQEIQLNLFEHPDYVNKEYESIIHHLPTPHLDKLYSTLNNPKLPKEDVERLENAIEKYHQWVSALNATTGSSIEEVTAKMVQHLNEYKEYIDVNVIFDSKKDFLYRQKGQLRLDNTIVEDFLPRLIYKTIYSELVGSQLSVGPVEHFCSVYFNDSLKGENEGLVIKTKSQGFAISKKLYLQASHNPNFLQAKIIELSLAFIIAEFKTNLDKTMFQEACATATEVKSSVTGAKYFLLCEWLDMPPVNTSLTDIDEVLLLRKAKRLPYSIRKHFHSYENRQQYREEYVNYLKEHPFQAEMFVRLVTHIKEAIHQDLNTSDNVLSKGYF
jgi:hypothetical protein